MVDICQNVIDSTQPIYMNKQNLFCQIKKVKIEDFSPYLIES